jgi:hypothetical protein
MLVVFQELKWESYHASDGGRFAKLPPTDIVQLVILCFALDIRNLTRLLLLGDSGRGTQGHAEAAIVAQDFREV